MAVNPLDYADIYEDVRDQLLPGLFRTGVDPEDAEAATYAVYTVAFDQRTGQPLAAEVVGVNRVGVLAQITDWTAQIAVLEKKILNTELFLEDADKAPMAEVVS